MELAAVARTRCHTRELQGQARDARRGVRLNHHQSDMTPLSLLFRFVEALRNTRTHASFFIRSQIGTEIGPRRHF